MYYKNIGTVEKTFYNVTFKPGDVKEVPGFINVKKFIRLSDKDAKIEIKQEVKKDNKIAENKTIDVKENKNKPETKVESDIAEAK
jgi:hypothetical protein